MLKYLGLLFGLFILSACSSATVMPDEFWGVMSWRYEPREGTAYGIAGSALVTVKFTRTDGNNYSVTGTVQEFETSCEMYNYLPEPCIQKSCEVASVEAGTVQGYARLENGLLKVVPSWDDLYEINVETLCNPFADAVNLKPSENTATIMESLNPAQEDPFIGEEWSIDVADITFIDDLPAGEVTDVKTGYKNFAALGVYSKGEGLFGLYRNQPE